jgi:hypothetical protein
MRVRKCLTPICALALVVGLAIALSLPIREQVRASESVRTQNQSARELKPSFVLIEYNPWAMVIGADSPSFALYDDGTIIFWKRLGRGGLYLSVKLTEKASSELLRRINPQAFGSLINRYEPAAGITDQPEYLIVVQKPDGQYKGVSIYGSLRRVGGTLLQTKEVPQILIDAFQLVSTYDNADAREWLPDFIEVIIWPYEYAPDKNLPWPKDWPTLRDLKTIKRGDGYSLFIEKSRYGALTTFLSKRREKQAVQIDGKKWAISIRMPFPSESTWNEVKRQIEQDRSRKP